MKIGKIAHANAAPIPDDKALAIAAYGESVAAYRYIILAEKTRLPMLHEAFEGMAAEERGHRDRLQAILSRLATNAAFYLTNEDKSAVCVGPRLLDARDDAHFDEAMRLVIASEKRTSSFYHRAAARAADEQVKALFEELALEGLEHVQKLRGLFKEIGKDNLEPCPMQNLR